MREDTLLCCNSSCLSFKVSEDEIWSRDAAVRECPVSGGDGKKVCCVLTKHNLSNCVTVFAYVIMSPFSQLLYTGIVIYAPALILNQGRRDHLMPLSVCINGICTIKLHKKTYTLTCKPVVK